MAGIASKSQLRMSLLRHALVTVPAVLLLGTLSGALSGSAEENGWFAALDKPDFVPPAWLFGVAWTILYALLGLALALLLHARGARRRGRVIALFAAQLALNFAWAPLFFVWREVAAALTLLAAMAVVTAVLIPLAWRIRPVAALLLLPYLGWLLFATAINVEPADPFAHPLLHGHLRLAGHAGDGAGGAVHHLDEIVEQTVLGLHRVLLAIGSERDIGARGRRRNRPCVGIEPQYQIGRAHV